MRTRLSRNRIGTRSMLVRYLVLLLLLSVGSPGTTCLQAEHNFLERGLGTSFLTASQQNRGSKQVQMQVCITIGCCHHVCRQFAGESSSEQHPQLLSPFTSEPGTLETTEIENSEQNENNIVLAPSHLEWSPQISFTSSMKLLTIINTGNDSWIKVLRSSSTNEQFLIQAVEEDAIAPGGSFSIAVVFLPRKLGIATGRVLIETSGGSLQTEVRGEGLSNPYQLSPIQAQAVTLQLSQQSIKFHNPHNEAVEIREVQIWPDGSHKETICLSAQEHHTSCFADSFPKAVLSNSKYEEYSVDGSVVSVKKKDPWKIEPEKSAEIVDVQMIRETGAWRGSVFIRFSRTDIEEVMLLPFEVEACPQRGGCKEKVSGVSDNNLGISPGDNLVAPATSGKRWAQSDDPHAVKIAESLLKDVTHSLFRQQELRKGSLGNEAKLFTGQVISYPKVQTGRKEELWINLVNPTKDPILVNLALAPEVMSRDCKYRANWFWQGEKPQMYKQNAVFVFNVNAVTEAVLQGGNKVALGPLTFRPRQKCDWSGLLFVKNNHSGLEWIPLRGTGGSAKLEVLDDNITVQKLKMIIKTKETCDTRVSKNFQIKNSGDMPLEVYTIETTAPGITLSNAGPFTLAVGETTDIIVSYEPDFQAPTAKQVLRLTTSTGIIEVPVAAKLPPELIAICRQSPFHEKVALPVSICALVLVLGVFSWLLLQEFPETKEAISKRSSRVLKEEYSKTWMILHSIKISWKASFAKVVKYVHIRISRANTDVSENRKLKPLVAFHQPLPESPKIKKKKKIKDNYSPRSHSSSGPASPHSCSESEQKVTSLERILDSSRFPDAKISARKSKSQVSLMRKEMKIDTDVDSARNRKVEVGRPAKDACTLGSLESPTNWSAVSKRASYDAATHKPTASKKHAAKNLESLNVKSSNILKSDNVHQVVDNGLTPLNRPSATPLSTRAPGRTHGTNEQALRTLQIEKSTSCNNKLTSIGHLRREAAQLTNEKPQQSEQSFYDIWGDHFAEISNAFSSPTSSPNRFTDMTQSLFSESLPASSSSNKSYAGSTWSNTTSTSMVSDDSDDFQLPSPEEVANSFMFDFLPVPAIETYTGLPEPPQLAVGDWNNIDIDSIYRMLAS